MPSTVSMMSVTDLDARELKALKALADGRTMIERGNYARARRRLWIARRQGEESVRQTAEELLAQIRRRRTGRLWAVLSVAVGAPTLAATAIVAAMWANLPDAEETRRIARSAHIHVAKSTVVTGAGKREMHIKPVGNRFDYSLNVSLDNVSAHFVNAAIASEDHRLRELSFGSRVTYIVGKFAQAFFRCALIRATSNGARCPGNSTVPQQLARNLLGSEHRGALRKAVELVWAIKMEHGLGKDEILEFYVNRLYLGNANHGVEMASRDYFGKAASDLALGEAALLAAAIKKPNWNLRTNRSEALRRARVILKTMKREGYAAPHAALPEDLGMRRGARQPNRPYLGHLWQWARKEVEAHLRELPDGSYKVFTTTNAEIQVYAESELEKEIRRWQRDGVEVAQGAVVVARPDGAVIAMVGGIGDDIAGRGTNRAKRTKGRIPRPPASTFKPFVYLAGLEQGLTPESMISAEPVEFPDEAGGERRIYRPENYDGRRFGMIPMRDGIVHSINTAAVRLLERIGYERLFDTLERLGLKTQDLRREWGLALGASGVALIEMVDAYSTVANGGYEVVPHAVTAIATESGRIVRPRRSAHVREAVFDGKHIRALDAMLREAVQRGTGIEAASSRLLRDMPIAGKTGTGDGFVDAWFIGYTTDLVIGVWFGNDRPMEMTGLYGGTGPARTFKAIMMRLVEYTDLAPQRGR